jgi:hypothetical protein
MRLFSLRFQKEDPRRRIFEGPFLRRTLFLLEIEIDPTELVLREAQLMTFWIIQILRRVVLGVVVGIAGSLCRLCLADSFSVSS